MDNRTLIAFGMLLALVAFALQKQAVDGNAVEKIVTFLSGGITGAMVPRSTATASAATGKDAARAVALILLAFGALILHGCYHGNPPWPGDPTAPPPPDQPFQKIHHVDGGSQ